MYILRTPPSTPPLVFYTPLLVFYTLLLVFYNFLHAASCIYELLDAVL
jgi:hypothetical protein